MESCDLLLVVHHLALGLVLVNQEVKSIFLKDFNRALGLHSVELSSHLTCSMSEDLELFALNQVLKVRDLADKLLQEDSPSLNKLWIVVVLHLHRRDIDSEGNLLRDSRDVASRPSLVEAFLEGFELIKSSLAGPISLGIAACHSVLGDLTNLDRVSD